MILHNGTSIFITIRFQKFGSSYIEYIPNDEQKAIGKGETEKKAEEEMTIMCNLGQEIEDRAMLQGIEKGEERMEKLIDKLMEQNCQEDIKKVISDSLYRKKLFAKFKI